VELSSTIIERYLQDAGVYQERSRIPCPDCGPDRKKQSDRSLAVHVRDGKIFYYCHHCQQSGVIREDGCEIEKETPIVNAASESTLIPEQIVYLVGRGISVETIESVGLINGMIYVRDRGQEVPCIGFRYLNHDGSTATKWRDGKKNFTQTGVASSLWRIEKFIAGDLVITEGEMDALSLIEVGIEAVSVPNGAPSGPVKDDGVTGKKFSYLWAGKEAIDSADRVIIATDADAPGDVLAEEIARRIGKARCWRVRYPDGCKDCNDVLVRHGPEILRKCVVEATPWPVGGLRNASEYKIEAMDLYRSGMSRGVKVGVGLIDQHFQPCPGTLVICTGIPGSGKSTFLTWLSVQLASKCDWNVAVFSAETSSQIHLLNMAAMYKGQPFRGPNRMSESDLSEAIDWCSDRFVFLDEAETSIQSVIERAQAAVLRHGVRLLMIDPYNWITGDDSSYEAQTYNINRMLVQLKSFAVAHDIAVWLVAHPTKLARMDGGRIPIPTGYDISGSAAFFNVADNGITVSRIGNGVSRVTSWKTRFPWLGSTGYFELSFNPDTGVFGPLKEWGDSEEDFEV